MPPVLLPPPPQANIVSRRKTQAPSTRSRDRFEAPTQATGRMHRASPRSPNERRQLNDAARFDPALTLRVTVVCAPSPRAAVGGSAVQVTLGDGESQRT